MSISFKLLPSEFQSLARVPFETYILQVCIFRSIGCRAVEFYSQSSVVNLYIDGECFASPEART